MIPHSLSLTNFISYRQASLDFRGIHVACLVGPNGAGKSALLDAITWALWGRSRARRDDDLVHFGEDEMAVELTFDLGGQLYRVIRQRRAGRRGISVLELQVRDGESWRSISESGIRLTQEKIERILRLDYGTFVNSAFLRQGHADEFTVKTAAERKRVLGEILRLDRWADYEDRVKKRQGAVRAEIELAELRLREIDSEIARRPEYEAQLERASIELASLTEESRAAEAAYRLIEEARTELRHAEARVADLGRRVALAERELARIAQERVTIAEQMERCEILLAEAEAILEGYRALLRAEEREHTLGSKLRQSAELDGRRAALEAQILEARRELETQRDVIVHRIADLEPRVPDDDLLSDQDAVRARLAHVMQLSDGRDAARLDQAHISEERAETRAQNEALRKDMEALRERIVQLEQAAAECPLCGQELTEDHRLSLLDQFQIEGEAKGDEYRSNLRKDEALAGRGRALEHQISEAARVVESLPTLQRQDAAISARIDRGRQAEEELHLAREELTPVVDRLAREDYASEVRQQLSQVLEEAVELGYDIAAHEQARRDVAENRVFADRKAQLESAQTRRDEAQTALERLSEDAERWTAEREAEAEQRTTVEQHAAALGERLREAPAVEAELERVRREEASARQRLGASVQRLEACKALERQRADKVELRDALAAEQSINDELRTAFGVKGVPAMIIEAAVPEIEAEANRLLARMTGGRMHVRFETQRETQAGDVRETLEIKISDELGTRPYENYSGGEQFRVNFAIRIALSKLLARRAGARLQTLVIDEGFGTQDAEGRQRLVQAVNAVGDDFARILVITHIDELRDAFPVRIEVTKTPEGSVVDVV